MIFGDRESTLRLTKKIATFSLDSAQLEIGVLTNSKGQSSKGMNLVFPSQRPVRTFGPRGTCCYILDDVEVGKFLTFLDRVLENELPSEYRFVGDRSGRWLGAGDCLWKITKFVEKWHGGGGYRGRFDNSLGSTITKTAVEELRQTIRSFFGDAP